MPKLRSRRGKPVQIKEQTPNQRSSVRSVGGLQLSLFEFFPNEAIDWVPLAARWLNLGHRLECPVLTGISLWRFVVRRWRALLDPLPEDRKFGITQRFALGRHTGIFVLGLHPLPEQVVVHFIRLDGWTAVAT